MPNTSIFIALPAYGGSIKTGCHTSIVNLYIELFQARIAAVQEPLDVADPVLARNILASMFLDRTDRTHLLFIDSDMEFSAKTVLKMIALNLPIVGCIYPKRESPPAFVVWHDDQKFIEIKNGNADMPGVGMGLCLIARTVFEQLIAGGKIRKGRGISKRKVSALYGFFDRITVDNDDLPEDFSFCRRWRDAGGKVRTLLNEDIGHIGDTTYRANYLDHLKASKSD